MIGRKLLVIDINDLGSVQVLHQKSPLCEYRVIRSWEEMQSFLAKEAPAAPDILLIDIVFDDLAGACVPGLPRVIPVGPTLALPFLLARRIMSFGVYSAHFREKALREYPPFLMAMGLIMAKCKGSLFDSKWVSLDAKVAARDPDRSLDRALGAAFPVASSVEGVMDIALPAYRKTLFAADYVTFLNVDEVDAHLAALETDATARHADVGLPDNLCLEVSSEWGLDALLVSSLFADKIGWAAPRADAASISDIRGTLSGILVPKSPYDLAMIVMRELNNGSSKRVDYQIQETLKKRELAFTLEACREVMRLCVLFANVHQCMVAQRVEVDLETQRNGKQGVYKLLGEGVETHTYKSWFGKRSSKKPTRAGAAPARVCRESLDILALDPLSSNGGLFLGPNSIVSESDHKLVVNYCKYLRELHAKRKKPFPQQFETFLPYKRA